MYVRDMKVIKREMEPVVRKLEEEQVDLFSLVMFFASWVHELLHDIDDKDKKELILKRMLD